MLQSLELFFWRGAYSYDACTPASERTACVSANYQRYASDSAGSWQQLLQHVLQSLAKRPCLSSVSMCHNSSCCSSAQTLRHAVRNTRHVVAVQTDCPESTTREADQNLTWMLNELQHPTRDITQTKAPHAPGEQAGLTTGAPPLALGNSRGMLCRIPFNKECMFRLQL